jgi:hypothetical protein
MHFGMQDIKARKTMLNEDSLRNLLMCIPTERHEPAASSFLPFPIHNYTLAEWVDYFESNTIIDSIERTSEPPSPGDLITRAYDDIKSGVPKPLTAQEVKRTQLAGETMEKQLHDSFVKDCLSAGIDPNNFEWEDFLSAASFPPAPVHPQALSELSALYANSNIYGRCALIFNDVETEQRRLKLLKVHCDTRNGVLEKAKMDLMQKMQTLRKAEDALEGSYRLMLGLQDEVDEMHTTVSSAENNPQLRLFMDLEQKVQSTPLAPNHVPKQQTPTQSLPRVSPSIIQAASAVHAATGYIA